MYVTRYVTPFYRFIALPAIVALSARHLCPMCTCYALGGNYAILELVARVYDCNCGHDGCPCCGYGYCALDSVLRAGGWLCWRLWLLWLKHLIKGWGRDVLVDLAGVMLEQASCMAVVPVLHVHFAIFWNTYKLAWSDHKTAFLLHICKYEFPIKRDLPHSFDKWCINFQNHVSSVSIYILFTSWFIRALQV